MSTRSLSVTFGPQLIALITRSADSASYWAGGCSSSASAFVKHCVSLTAGSCSDRTIAVGKAVLLNNALAVGQYVTVLVELQRVLRSVGQRVERRMSHVLRGEMLIVADHVRRWQMAERRLVLMETGGNHVASSRGLGHSCTSRRAD